jgi:hypothetical protein
MPEPLREFHTSVCCPHPYFGFVCTPNSVLDFSAQVPGEFGHRALAVIDQNGFRNIDFPLAKPDDEIWIGIFGGSVAFSVPATDNEHTIAGYLEGILNGSEFREAIFPKRRVRVLNYALPGGQQPQQLLIYLFNRKLLDGVITFDGVNEVVIPAYYNAGAVPPTFPYRPYYEAVFARKVTDEQAALSWLLETEKSRFASSPAVSQVAYGIFHRRYIDSIRNRLKATSPDGRQFVSLYFRPGIETDSVRTGALNWRDNVLLMNLLYKSEGAEGLFVLQPVPERGKKLTSTEQSFLSKQNEVLAIRDRGYRLLQDHLQELQAAGVHCIDFREVFVGEARTVYSDLIHFEDYGCNVVARELGDYLRRSWRLFGGGNDS